MATEEQETKQNDKAIADATQSAVSTATAALPADPAAAAMSQQYYQQYGYYYPYGGYGYNGYDATNTQTSQPTAEQTAAYQQYYQQLQQYQQQQQLVQTNDTNKTTQNSNTPIITSNQSPQKVCTLFQDPCADSIAIKHKKDLREWSHVEVSEWVKTVSDGKFADKAQAFLDNEIDGKVLYDITAKQLETGLYLKNMMKRLEFFELIQTLKQTTNTNGNGILSVAELERAPPIKKKKKKKKKKQQQTNGQEEKEENGNNGYRPIGTAAYLKLNAEQSKLSNMTSSELLMAKHSHNNKRKLDEMEDKGKQHRIDWKYREREKYKDMNIELNDRVLFEWKWTRNVWKFANRKAFDEDNFDTFVAEQLAGVNCRKYEWRAKKKGMHYFGCQVANCCTAGNMKIRINVIESNPTKKQKT